MRCEDVLEFLTDASAELPTDVARHLEECAACQRDRTTLSDSWEMLEGWPTLEPSADFTARVMASVQQEDEQCARLLVLALEAERPDAMTLEVRQHLDACARCQAEVATVSAAWSLLGEWKDIEPAPTFVRQVMQRAGSTEDAPVPHLTGVPNPVPSAVRPSRPASRLLSPRTIRALASIAAVFVMVVGIFALIQPRQTDPTIDSHIDTVRRPAVVQTAPATLAESSETRILDDVRDPSLTMKTDDVLEEILKDPNG